MLTHGTSTAASRKIKYKIGIAKKLLLTIIPIFILAFLCSGYIIYLSVKKEIISSVEREAYCISQKLTSEVEGSFNESMTLTSNLADIISSDIQDPREFTREDIIQILQNTLAANPELVAVYVGFEPDAFDGQDNYYINSVGHDSTGRFVPYVNRIDGDISLEPLEDYNSSVNGDYYQLPKIDGKSHIIEPYIYRGIYMTSIVVPIKDANGKFLGIVGCDRSLESLDSMISKIKLFNTGDAYLVSNKGAYISYPNKALLGYSSLTNINFKEIDAAFNQDKGFVKNVTYEDVIAAEKMELAITPEMKEINSQLAAEVSAGKSGVLEYYDNNSGQNIWVLYNPINVFGVNTPWSLLANVPIKEAMEPVAKMFWLFVIIAIVTLILVIVIVILNIRHFLRPLDNTVKILKDVTKGDLTKRVKISTKDELEVMGIALNNMLDSMQKMIADRKKIEEELIRTSKLDSLGFLAGGIAHDFNNILQIISGNLYLIKMKKYKEEKLSEKLDEIEKATLQATNLIKQLLTFTKGGVPVKKLCSLEKLLRETTNLVLSGSNLKPELFISKDLWQVEIDEGQINQVINNLLINAIHAMPDGGMIRIEAVNTIIQGKSVLPLEEGKYVMLAFKDNGVGISQENLIKIFDPFFTTKESGSGLGLSTSYYIINRHNGYITAESQIGIGTTFYIYLPAFSAVLD